MAASKKILYIITKAGWGGAQRYVFDLVTNLNKEEFSASVAFGTKGTLADKLTELTTPLYPISSLQRDFSFIGDIRSFFTLIRICRKVRPHVAHLNSSKGGALGALAARLSGVPKIVFTVHGWAFNEARPAWQKRLIMWVQWVTVLLSHQTITVSRYDFEQAKNWALVGKKIRPIHNGIGTIFYKERSVAREELAKRHTNLSHHLQDFWIGTTSELHANKGLEYLLRAFAEVSHTQPNSIVVIIGAGEKIGSLQLLASDLGIAKRVFFLGFIEHAAEYLQAFDVFTLTSRKEGLPYALLEAALESPL